MISPDPADKLAALCLVDPYAAPERCRQALREARAEALEEAAQVAKIGAEEAIGLSNQEIFLLERVDAKIQHAIRALKE